MRLIGYIRVSTGQQAEEGVSLDAQKAKLEAYCALYDHTLVRVEVDAGASGKTLDRKGLKRALRALDAGKVDGVIVAKLDRLTRSVRDLSELLDGWFQRGALVSVAEQCDTSTAAGRLVLNVLTSVAQWERETISERTRSALEHKRNRGERVGHIPFGYRLDDDGVHLVEDEAEQAIIALVAKQRAKGVTWRALAEVVNSAGYRTRKGRAWRHNSLYVNCKGRLKETSHGQTQEQGRGARR